MSNISKQLMSYSSIENQVQATFALLDAKEAVKKLFTKDASLWKTDSDAVKSINNRLGWLASPENSLQKADELIAFTEQLKQEGFTDAVLLGMGGSSLCSEVAKETFGSAPGFLQLHVLDNTSPEAISDLEKQIDAEKTLFIAASKSGGTKETISFFRYFYDKLQAAGKTNTGNNFIAITDDGTPLVKMAEDFKFRKTFINPTDIGGRYSVLSYFGVLPMALMGIDIKALLASAQAIENQSKSELKPADNPAVSLGALLGTAAQNGRDKVTFVLSSSIQSFGYWVEQLIAESTGKEGKALIPISNEQLGNPIVYGNDRVFVHICLATDECAAADIKLSTLEKAGHPVVKITLEDKAALGGEYYRWEVVTAIAGAVLGINPFDEPNVAESKKNTENLLKEWEGKNAFAEAAADITAGNISVYSGGKAKTFLENKNRPIADYLKAFANMAMPGDYIAVLPYFFETGERNKILQTWRHQLRDELKVATTLLTGPRYLHSTGQLHKGGPDTGLYIILMPTESAELQIPEEPYGFATLHRAQALGDFRSLNDKGRRVIRIDLGKDVDAGLQQLAAIIK